MQQEGPCGVWDQAGDGATVQMGVGGGNQAAMSVGDLVGKHAARMQAQGGKWQRSKEWGSRCLPHLVVEDIINQ